MKIFIDIGHPAHVHYFRNFIRIMGGKGHEFFVSARDREVIHALLRHYGIPFYNRGKGANGMAGKLLYIFRAGLALTIKGAKFKPDLFISFASPYAAHAAWLLRKPHIVLDDTESASLNHVLYAPFSKVILNPSSFQKNMGYRQIFFDSYIELSYLHPRYFAPDKDILSLLGLQPGDHYALLRFVSWNANHDVGQKGLSEHDKRELVQKLSRHMTVFISSEGHLPDDLKKYRITIPPEKLHHALAFARLIVSEGATTASECAMLGTPIIYVNSLSAGTLEDQQRQGIIHIHSNADELFGTINEIMENPQYIEQLQVRRHNMLSQKIDITAFLVWFVEAFPQSAGIMKENPEYQYNFLQPRPPHTQ